MMIAAKDCEVINSFLRFVEPRQQISACVLGRRLLCLKGFLGDYVSVDMFRLCLIEARLLRGRYIIGAIYVAVALRSADRLMDNALRW
jgi:hypothetical protein